MRIRYSRILNARKTSDSRMLAIGLDRCIMRSMRRLNTHILFLTLMVWLTGCNLVQASPSIPPTATTLRVAQATAVPTLARIYQPIAQTQTATPTPEIRCPDLPDTPTVQHTVQAEMDFAEQRFETRQRTTFVNRTGETLNDLVFNIEPNRWPEAFTLLGMLQLQDEGGNVIPNHTLTGRRLYMELVEPLEAGCVVELELLFVVDVPRISSGVNAFKGFFGHSTRQINTGHWLPSLAVRMDGEWITRQAMFVGEQEVVRKADWDVTISAINAPDTLKIAAPGRVREIAPMSWQYIHNNARDFTVSVSDAFQVETMQAQSGVFVEVYSFEDAQVITETGVVDAANHALNIAVRSLEAYEDLYGPYPYERMLVVQGDFPDGMEFSGIVFVSTDWFKNFQGDPASFLTLITAHEVSHQWWYARVGNDPALSPWLDEALATYSEYVFLEEYYPNLKAWWWDFRVHVHAPQGFVDRTVYEFTSMREYINAVYLRGVIMLHAIRTDIGTEAFFELLRRYIEVGEGQVVTADVFWSVMTPEQIEATQRTRSAYLRRPNVTAAGGG